MAEQDIFIENALPSDSNIAQALDALACVALLVGVVDLFVHPSVAVAIFTVIVPAAVAALAYYVRWWAIHKAGSSASDAMNATYEVTDERVKILHSQIDGDLCAAVDGLKGHPMDGVDLVRRLARTIPKNDLLRAMSVLLPTLNGTAAPSTPYEAALPSNVKIPVSTQPGGPTPVAPA